MTAFAAESQSGKYSINYSYYTLKSPEIGISWIAWLNLSPQGRDLEIAAGILFPDPARRGWKGASIDELSFSLFIWQLFVEFDTLAPPVGCRFITN